MSSAIFPQYQATAASNQLVLGVPQGVLNVQGFGQVSQLNIPDPGTAKTSFILEDTKSGTQTINTTLTVNGTVTTTGTSSSNGLNVNGNIVLDNSASRFIEMGTAAVPAEADLTIQGSASSGAVTGGAVNVVAGTSATGTGGAVKITSGQATTSGPSGPVTIQSGAVVSAGTAGPVSIDTGAGGTGTPTVSLGNVNAAQINIANNSAVAPTLNIGNNANGLATTVNLANGTGVTTLNLGNTTTGASAITIGSTVSTSTITSNTSIKMNNANNGFLWTPATASAASNTVTVAGKAGVATFTAQTLAASSTLTLTITNVDAGTAGLINVYNTSAAAFSFYVQSVTWTAATNIVIVLQNGTATSSGSVTWTVPFVSFN